MGELDDFVYALSASAIHQQGVYVSTNMVGFATAITTAIAKSPEAYMKPSSCVVFGPDAPPLAFLKQRDPDGSPKCR